MYLSNAGVEVTHAPEDGDDKDDNVRHDVHAEPVHNVVNRLCRAL